MLHIVTGPFHPDLESALVEEVTRLKATDPLVPLAIVVPSAPLRQRLKRLLCIEHRTPLLDVHFLTFYQLAVHLLERAPFDPVAIRSPFVFRELVHQLLRRQPENSHWSGLCETPGAWGAIAATLRDLKDAGVETDRVLEALDQNGSHPSARHLLALYRDFLEEKARLEAYDEDDLAILAKDRVQTSPFLRRQRRIVYYGFYDLTQVQLDLFHAVARAYPTTLYFPLMRGHPAYAFAERFFERYVHGLVATESDAVSTRGGTRALGGLFRRTPSVFETLKHAASGPRSRIVSVSGRLDEVTVVAKHILSLVEERGYAFQDIGVVARTLSGYESVVPRIFGQHGIPLASTMSRPVAAFPFIKTLMQLLEMRESGLRRDQVVGFFFSPFVRRDALPPSRAPLRPDLWDLASRRLGITGGAHAWERLADCVGHDLLLRDTEDDGTGPRIPASHITLFSQAVGALNAALDRIPDTATWEEYTDLLEELSVRWLDPHGGPDGDEAADAAGLSQRLGDAFAILRQIDAMEPAVTLADFAEGFRRLMEELTIPLGSARGGGVQVMDAMAARGLPFRALFVLGLNDQVFPRHIQEDAFLRDDLRRMLEADLGFKIPEKLAGYDEETLLFYLLCNAAQDELTLLYQRADDAGRPLVPSGYLADITRLLGEGETAIPRRLSAKFHTAPEYRKERLTPQDLSLKLLLGRRVPRRLLEEVHPAGRLVLRGLEALERQESGQGRLGPYDGITGPLEMWWDRLVTRGVSASALQHYATCPFRYYAEHVLRLEALTLPETADQLDAVDRGTLAHTILRACLDTLRTDGHFDQASAPSPDPCAVLERIARAEFDRFARSHPVGYPLLWELHQEQLAGFLKETLRDDLAELSANGWEPILFETDMTGALTIELSGVPLTLPVFGRLDRVDWSPARRAYRIIDYKFKTGAKPQAADTNLLRGAVRGRRLQPPLYLLAAAANVPGQISNETSPATCDGVWFYYLAPQWEHPLTRVPFPGDAWTSELGGPLRRTLGRILLGIRSGHFFLFEDKTECARCDYRLLCRRTHQPTAGRARADLQMVRPYRELRRADVAGYDQPDQTGRSAAPMEPAS